MRSNIPHADTPALCIVILKNNGNWVSATPVLIDTNTNMQWIRIAYPLQYMDTIAPDTIFVAFSNNDIFMNQTISPSNILELDNISFSGTTQNLLNPGFENYAHIYTDYPTSWITRDLTNIMESRGTVTKSTDAQHGQYAAKLMNVASNNAPYVLTTASVTNDGMRPSFAVDQRFKALNGYLKFEQTGNDTAFIEVTMYKNGMIIANNRLFVTNTASGYTPFSDSINYFNFTDVPDSAKILIQGYYNYYGQSFGAATMYLDNLCFDCIQDTFTVTAIKNNAYQPQKLLLYPNPAKDYIALEFSQSEIIKQVQILDLKGNTVYIDNIATEFNGIKMFNTSTLPQGMYLIKIETDHATYMNKFVISR